MSSGARSQWLQELSRLVKLASVALTTLSAAEGRMNDGLLTALREGRTREGPAGRGASQG